MMRHTRLEHRFVQYLPEHLEPGVLYISMEYATAAHACCCGCGEQVVTPLTPTDWKMTFDGETISLSPSIGNWNMACRSHYFVKRNRVEEAPKWTNQEIASGRRMDKATKEFFYDKPAHEKGEQGARTSTPVREETPTLWSRLRRLLPGTKR